MTDRNPARTENLSDLIVTQVNFGLAYIQEARTAYNLGRFEYGDLARQIALNAYSTAARFADCLSGHRDPTLLNRLTAFKDEVDTLLREPVAVSSIA